jgi:uncharacterized protein (TIGR03435 family)
MGLRIDPDGVEGTAMTLRMLVQRAYGLRSYDDVYGSPDWGKTERFDIQAKMREADIAAMQKLSRPERNVRMEPMLQALLADRFKLKAHREMKPVPVYELVVAKGGARLKEAASDKDPKMQKDADGKPLAGYLQLLPKKVIAQGYSMKGLADLLSQPMSALRPVVDKTGLTGLYDFTLDWSPASRLPVPGTVSSEPSPEDTSSVFSALGELGLKLQPATGSVETVVIDHAEWPSEN